MGLREVTAKQPQPFKTFWWLGLFSFIPLAISIGGTADGALDRVLAVPFPLCLGICGLIFAFNVNDNAVVFSKITHESGPTGFSVAYIRLLGVGVCVVSAVLAVLFATGRG